MHERIVSMEKENLQLKQKISELEQTLRYYYFKKMCLH